MKQLIVTADDLGRDNGTNEAIEHAVRRGIVTSASLLVTGEAVEDALQRLSGVVPLGVHLNLTEGRALQGPITGLTDAAGRFRGLPQVASNLLTGRFDTDRTREELAAQVGRARSLGVGVAHLDGHHHVHVAPALLTLVLETCRAYEIPWVRVPQHALLSRPRAAGFKRLLLGVLAARARTRIARAGLGTSDHFRCLSLTGRGDVGQRLLALLSSLPEGLTEVLVHPRPGRDGEAETRALASEDLRGQLARWGVSLGGMVEV